MIILQQAGLLVLQQAGLLVLRHWKPLVIVGVLVAAGWGIHHAGYKSGYQTADHEWSEKWSARNAADDNAKIAAQAEALAEDARRAKMLGEIQDDAQLRIANADRAAAAARGSYDRLHAEAERLAAAIAAGDNSSIDRISKTGGKAAVLLADLFRRADSRAGELARVADRAIERGLTCQKQYESLRPPEKR